MTSSTMQERVWTAEEHGKKNTYPSVAKCRYKRIKWRASQCQGVHERRNRKEAVF